MAKDLQLIVSIVVAIWGLAGWKSPPIGDGMWTTLGPQPGFPVLKQCVMYGCHIPGVFNVRKAILSLISNRKVYRDFKKKHVFQREEKQFQFSQATVQRNRRRLKVP